MVNFSSLESLLSLSCRSQVYTLMICHTSYKFSPTKDLHSSKRCASAQVPQRKINQYAVAGDFVQGRTAFNTGKNLLLTATHINAKIQLTQQSAPRGAWEALQIHLPADVPPHGPHTDFKGKITPAFSFTRGILHRFPSLHWFGHGVKASPCSLLIMGTVRLAPGYSSASSYSGA